MFNNKTKKIISRITKSTRKKYSTIFQPSTSVKNLAPFVVEPEGLAEGDIFDRMFRRTTNVTLLSTFTNILR